MGILSYVLLQFISPNNQPLDLIEVQQEVKLDLDKVFSREEEKYE